MKILLVEEIPEGLEGAVTIDPEQLSDGAREEIEAFASGHATGRGATEDVAPPEDGAPPEEGAPDEVTSPEDGEAPPEDGEVPPEDGEAPPEDGEPGDEEPDVSDPESTTGQLDGEEDGDGEESDETLEDEAAETPDEQAQEQAEGTEQGGELKALVAGKLVAMREALGAAEGLGSSDPRARESADEAREHVDAAEQAASKITDDADPEEAQQAAQDFLMHFGAAMAACERCKLAAKPQQPNILGNWARRTVAGV